MKPIDILIIGAGISGSVLAERYASLGKKVLIIEKRNHIAIERIQNSPYLLLQ